MTSKLSRRSFLSCACCASLGIAAGLGTLTSAYAAGKKTDLTADQALALLKEGNQKFLAESPVQAAQSRERRLEIASGQTPFAVFVACSDSRVPPELLFSRGLGELFVVRNAGNTIDIAALGSVEYGVGVLGCPLVVVLGHENCGAVAAALEVVQRNATFPGVIGEMVQPIIPAVLASRGPSGEVTLDSA